MRKVKTFKVWDILLTLIKLGAGAGAGARAGAGSATLASDVVKPCKPSHSVQYYGITQYH
jgi:hypothetical protein